ncbi:MAG: type II secretion system protein GspG [Candidatus Polarisedimenticolia bacterium]
MRHHPRCAGPITTAIVAVSLVTLLLLPTGGCGRAGEEYSREVLHAIDQGKLTGTRGTMEAFGRTLQAYSIDHGGYPVGGTLQDAVRALSPAFVSTPVTTDAWGNDLSYESTGHSYTLTSPGADGRPGSPDDVVMTDGRFTRQPAPDAR